MRFMFYQATSANPNTSGWDTAAVTDMRSMFSGAALANPNTSGWDTSAVTDMRYMFGGATSANPDTSGWNTAAVTSMNFMFASATSFDQDLGSWDVTALTGATSMFDGVTLSTANYESLLTGWDAQALQANVTFSGGNSSYCSASAVAARANMIASDLWTITDAGQCTADLEVSKTVTQSPVAAGDPITYTITVTNNGPVDVVGALVEDTLPMQLSSATWECFPGAGASCTTTGSGDISERVNLPVGISVSYVLIADTAPGFSGVISNTATVAASSGTNDPDLNNNSATDNTTFYTIGGSVSGLSGAGLALQNNLGDNLAITADGNFTFATAQTVGSSYSVTVLTNPTSPSQDCTVSNDSGTLASANLTTVSVQCVTDSADLSVSKTDGQQNLVPGDPITYMITVSNNGPLDVVGAGVHDSLPMELSSATWSCIPGTNASCTDSGTGDINDLVDIPNGSSVSYVLTAATAVDFVGLITNTVTVTPPSNITDPDPGNNTATDQTATQAIFMNSFEEPLGMLKRWLEEILKN